MYMYIFTFVCMYMYMYVCIYVYVCMYMYTYESGIKVVLGAAMSISVHDTAPGVCMNMYIYVCVYIHTYLYLYVRIYIHIVCTHTQPLTHMYKALTISLLGLSPILSAQSAARIRQQHQGHRFHLSPGASTHPR